MNIYLHELKSYRKNTILWIFSISGMLLVFMSFYPMIRNDTKDFLKLMENFPPALKAAMGIAVNTFTSLLGYYSFIFTYSSLLAAIQAANLGIGVLSKEQRERTADFLMTKPVSRTRIVTEKLLAVLTLLVITNVAYFAAAAVIIHGFSKGDFDFGKLSLINLSLLLLQIIFFSIGFAVSFSMKKIRSVLPVSLGLVFLFFAVSAFAVTSEDDKLRYITPFQYFKAADILEKGKYDTGFLIIGVLIVIVCTALSYSVYKHKNIPAL